MQSAVSKHGAGAAIPEAPGSTEQELTPQLEKLDAGIGGDAVGTSDCKNANNGSHSQYTSLESYNITLYEI